MRRNARSIPYADDFSVSSIPLHSVEHNELASNEDIFEMKFKQSCETNRYNNTHRLDSIIEAKVEIGDTLQAVALRFHCTVADIKRLNKIDKDNEIHARKVIKIPLTVHNVLLDNFPIVHKSGNNSPKLEQKSGGNGGSRGSDTGLTSIIRNPLEDAEAMLSEKLMVASVNSSSLENPKQVASSATEDSINDIVLNSKITSGVPKYSDEDIHNFRDAISAPLIPHILDESTNIPQLQRIKGPSFNAMDWSGSDCDMSWICLFIVILALCFVIPLVYVFYIAEHSHHNSTGHTTHTQTSLP